MKLISLIILANCIVLPDTCVQNGVVALTIDEGPTAYTDEILDILEKKNVQVTFHFNPAITGSEFTRIYSRAEEDGHELGIRTSPKRVYTDEMDYSEAQNDLDQQVQYLQSKTSDKIIYARSPQHGGLPVQSVYNYFTKNGMVLSTYSCNPQEDPTVDPVDRINEFLGPNNPQYDSYIIQLYEQRLSQDRNLPEIIDAIHKSGYDLVVMSTCLKGYKPGEPVAKSNSYRTRSLCSQVIDVKFVPYLLFLVALQ